MTSDSLRPIEDLFSLAAPLDPNSRRCFLDAHCPDGERRRQLEELLVHHDGTSLLDEDDLLIDGLSWRQHLIGLALGPYRILEVIACGGMGAVCLAEQTDPVYRQVALKLIKPEARSPELQLRFENERQILAVLRHPHIVGLLDAGSEHGTPYFVMENVRGAPIDRFCNETVIGWRARLRLFLQLCGALQHVHDNGVVHRDVKPANVLVTTTNGRPWVRLVDFGIAKVLDGPDWPNEGVVRVGPTGGHGLLGTPEYMSPEQVRSGGLDVDARSDVYSAGVLLSTLFPAETPLVRSRTGDTQAGATIHSVVERATHLDRDRRYPSMKDLASDCRGCLRDDSRSGSRSLSRPRRHGKRAWFDLPSLRSPAAVLALIFALLILGAQIGTLQDFRVAPFRSTGPPSSASSTVAPLENEPTGTTALSAQTVIRVPHDVTTIQNALDMATSGDLVLVDPGTYKENLQLPEGVALESRDGPEQTTIDGDYRGPVINCAGVSSKTSIRGFRIVHGRGEFGGGIRCWDGASPVIENNVFTDNLAKYGGAIAARFDSYPKIRNNRIYRNRATLEGGGIYGIDGLTGTLTVSQNEIRENRAGPGHAAGGGIWIGGIQAAIVANDIRDNLASGSGGGIWAGFSGEKLIHGNSIHGNSASLVGGAIWADQGVTAIEDNWLIANAAPQGSGIATGNRGTKTIRCNIYGTGGDGRFDPGYEASIRRTESRSTRAKVLAVAS